MSTVSFTSIEACRICDFQPLHHIQDFGDVPLADKLTETIHEEVFSAPLNLLWCPNCSHLQIAENIDPEILFNDSYPYYSSRIPEVVQHFLETTERIQEKRPVCSGDLVVEIASNDGVLLRNFVAITSNVLGIEPSADHADLCNAEGLETVNSFFSSDVAKDILQRKGPAQLILANNVLAHVPNPVDLVRAIYALLDSDGMAVIEVPYSMNMLINCSFDVVFHQHFSYFSLHSLIHLFNSNDLFINDIDKIETQGGSYRLFIEKVERIKPSIKAVLAEEANIGIRELATYHRFSESILRTKKDLIALLVQLRDKGHTLAGYGAPGKAATLLNYFGIDQTLLKYLVDISDTKQNKYFPVTGLYIHPLSKMDEIHPDYLLILAWNYADSIIKSLDYLQKRGCHFILPYPKVTVI